MSQSSTERRKGPGTRTAAIVLSILAAACGSRPVPAAPVPAPLPVPPAWRSETTPRLVESSDTLCVVRIGRLELVEIDLRDSTYQGQPVARPFPVDSTYAENGDWYRSSAPIVTPVGTYVKYGLPRILGPVDVVPVTTFRGVTLFAEPRANLGRPDVVYVPVRPGCVFQPYTHGEISGDSVRRRR